MRWNRKSHDVWKLDVITLTRFAADVDPLVLLTLDYVCVKNGIQIPWEEVAKNIDPTLSGEAIKQHLAKVTKFRELGERAVPEKLDKGARRRSSKLAPVDTTTLTKSGRGKKVKKEDADEQEGNMPVRGASLLYYEPPKTKEDGKESSKCCQSARHSEDSDCW